MTSCEDRREGWRSSSPSLHGIGTSPLKQPQGGLDTGAESWAGMSFRPRQDPEIRSFRIGVGSDHHRPLSSTVSQQHDILAIAHNAAVDGLPAGIFPRTERLLQIEAPDDVEAVAVESRHYGVDGDLA